MLTFGSILNLDLLSVGFTVAGMLVLGFLAHFNNRENVTTRMFLLFACVTAAWSIANYIQYSLHNPTASLWALRSIVFIATWHAYSFLLLCFAFPHSKVEIPRWISRHFLIGAVATSLLTLTPFVFEKATELSADGAVTAAAPGPGIVIFLLFISACIASALFFIARTGYRSSGTERQQITIMGVGMLVTFVSIDIFNVGFPLLLDNTRFLPLSAVNILPFMIATAYAVSRHGLFQIKVLAAGVLVFALALISFAEIIFAQDLSHMLFRLAMFTLILVAGISLVRTVVQEVEERELIQKLSDEKSEFMTFASHEIRNPITAIRGYASLIYDGTTGETNQETRLAAQKILVRGNDVLMMIAEFLSKSKAELGKISFSVGTFDIVATTVALVEDFKPHAQIRKLTLESKIDHPQRILINADEQKLREVLGNLIDNSLKYTKEGGVTVTVERHGVSVRILVSDTGVGIPAAVLPELFKKFSRADAQKVNLLGTGVGLYLGKQFIEGMGGRIWAESDGEGKGSRFIIEFPVSQS